MLNTSTRRQEAWQRSRESIRLKIQPYNATYRQPQQMGQPSVITH